MRRLLFIALAATVLAGGIAYAAKPRRSFVIATPKPGKINIAVLRFDLKRGAKPPRLHISTRYKPPARAAVVTAVIRVRGMPNRYLGLVAIVNFRAARNASALHRARDTPPAQVTADNYEFVLEANGAGAPLGGEWAGGSRVHTEFVHKPAIPQSQAASYDNTLSGLIARIIKILRGFADPNFTRAVGGEPPLGDFILEVSANHFHNGPGDSTLFGCARTSPAQPGASYTDTITKPDKSTASRTDVLDSAGKATISTPINQYGDYTQELAVTSGGKTVTKTVTSSVTSTQGQNGCA
jgi:hypothetical protein